MLHSLNKTGSNDEMKSLQQNLSRMSLETCNDFISYPSVGAFEVISQLYESNSRNLCSSESEMGINANKHLLPSDGVKQPVPMQCGIHITSEISNGDDDLEKVILNLPVIFPTVSETKAGNGSCKVLDVTKKMKNNSKSQHAITVSDILKTRRLEDANLEEINMKISKLSDSPQDEIIEPRGILENFDITETLVSNTVGPDRINDPPPGLHIIVQNIFSHFNDHDITLENCGYDSECNLELTKYEKFMLTPISHFSENLVINLSMCQTYNISNHDAFLKYLFKTASVSNNLTVINACANTIKKFISWTERVWPSKTEMKNHHHKLKQCRELEEQKLVKWCPRIVDIYVVLLNYGIDIECSCPLYDTLKEVKKDIIVSKSYGSALHTDNLCSEHTSPTWPAVSYNFFTILKILSIAIKSSCLYSSRELSNIFILLLWISLDRQILLSTKEVLIQECIAQALQKISEDAWEEEMCYMSTTLSACKLHHRNTLHQIQQIPVLFLRGRVFQATIAILTLKNLSGVSLPISENSKTTVVSTLLQDMHKRVRSKDFEDFYLMDTIVSLVDLVVCSELPMMKTDTIKALCILIMKIANCVPEDSNFPEKVKVKEHLVRIECKWKLISSHLQRIKEASSTVTKVNSQNLAKTTSQHEIFIISDDEEKDIKNICTKSIDWKYARNGESALGFSNENTNNLNENESMKIDFQEGDTSNSCENESHFRKDDDFYNNNHISSFEFYRNDPDAQIQSSNSAPNTFELLDCKQSSEIRKQTMAFEQEQEMMDFDSKSDINLKELGNIDPKPSRPVKWEMMDLELEFLMKPEQETLDVDLKPCETLQGETMDSESESVKRSDCGILMIDLSSSDTSDVEYISDCDCIVVTEVINID